MLPDTNEELIGEFTKFMSTKFGEVFRKECLGWMADHPYDPTAEADEAFENIAVLLQDLYPGEHP